MLMVLVVAIFYDFGGVSPAMIVTVTSSALTVILVVCIYPSDPYRFLAKVTLVKINVRR